jgi:hypothetical protein
MIIDLFAGDFMPEVNVEALDIEFTARFGDRVRAGGVLIGTQKAVGYDLKRTTLADLVSKIRSRPS